MNWIAKLAAIAVAASFVCSAQTPAAKPAAKTVVWSPPGTDWPHNMPPPTVPKEMIGSIRIANFPILLEKTTLEDARRHFKGTTGSHGDASEAEAWLCLTGTGANGPWIFWLQSFEINGATIGGFQWRSLSPNQTPDHRCKLLTKEAGRIELPLALHPGMAESEVRKILGPPTALRGKTLIYCHSLQEIIDKQTYDVANNIAVVLRDGVVQTIEVVKSTTN